MKEFPWVIEEPIRGSASGNQAPSEEITILESRRQFSDQKLLKLIKDDDGTHATAANNDHQTQLLIKLRTYFNSVIRSQGFECSQYPGKISGLTTVEPKQHIIINKNDRHLLGLNYIWHMAHMAIACYNRDFCTELKVMQVETVNAWVQTTSSATYYITFIASNEENGDTRTLQAKVHDTVLQREVIFCRRKPI